MRALGAIAILIFGIAGSAAARAADLPSEGAERNVFTHHVPAGRHIRSMVIYDFQPGVIVRAYWLAPWRHRHYFPFGAAKQEAEPSADNSPPEPAESFERYWSTSQTFMRELPLRARDEAPRDEQEPPPAIKK